VKFVASPSTLLPPERHDGDHAERLGLDSWSGYPASMARLLRFIDDEAIDGVVLLSGNAHFSCVTRFKYASGRRLHAIVASGLYAPWPFSNQHPDELVRDGDWRLEVAGTVVKGRFGGVTGHMTDSGYAVVAAGADAAGAPQLRVDLCPADGSAAQRVVFDV
jgi:cholesterol oxidase